VSRESASNDFGRLINNRFSFVLARFYGHFSMKAPQSWKKTPDGGKLEENPDFPLIARFFFEGQARRAQSMQFPPKQPGDCDYP